MKRRPARASAATAEGPKRLRKVVEVPLHEEIKEEWSYDRLWDPREVSSGWHARNVHFWRQQRSDLRGATGGGVSRADLAFTNKVVDDLMRRRSGLRFRRALDCGAGIGRVTDAVLRKCCEHVDLLEFVKRHLDVARARLPAHGKAGCTFGFHCSSVQKFAIKTDSYDLVWCQWLLMYLTDSDAIDFLTRARRGLAEGGFMLLKENVSLGDLATYFDDKSGDLWDEDTSAGGPVSCVRTPMHYEALIMQAGLQVVEMWQQADSTGDNVDMALWALVPLGKDIRS